MASIASHQARHLLKIGVANVSAQRDIVTSLLRRNLETCGDQRWELPPIIAAAVSADDEQSLAPACRWLGNLLGAVFPVPCSFRVEFYRQDCASVARLPYCSSSDALVIVSPPWHRIVTQAGTIAARPSRGVSARFGYERARPRSVCALARRIVHLRYYPGSRCHGIRIRRDTPLRP